MELPVAPLLRTLMAKYGAHGPNAQGAVVQRVVLNHRTQEARSELGAQGQLVAIETVGEGVHLLLDDVGDFTDSPHEQSGGLHDGRAHVSIAVRSQQRTELAFQPFPTRRFSRQQIIHALHAPEGLGLLQVSHAVAP